MKARRVLSGLSAIAFGVAFGAGCLGTVDRLYLDGDAGVGGGSGDAAGPDDPTPGPLNPAAIGGSAAGVAGPGLVLQNAGKDDVPVSSSGPFVFKTKLFPGEPYDVTVLTQPALPSQKCTVLNGAGTANGTDVTNVEVTCVTDAYKVGGTVVGLSGTGLVLQNNGGDDLAVAGDTFAFATSVPSNGTYEVTIKSQPSGQTCKVGGGSGTVVSQDVSSVVINCLANSYIIGGTVTGLAGSLVLQNNSTNDRLVTANGSFAFSTPISNGSTYAVSVKAQPTSPIHQTCAVTQGTGTVAAADVNSVKVGCTTNRYTVGGTVSGLTGTLVLANNGGNDKSITANGAFTFSSSVASGSAYAVTVKTQPFNQACQVTGGSGTLGGANVSSVSVKCSTLIAFSENFDGVTPPALPPGWTNTIAQGRYSWKTEAEGPTSPPNSMVVGEGLVAADVRLDSPAFTPGSTTAELSFQNKWYMANHYGGGVVEISIDGAEFQDIIAAGGIFMSGPYTGKLASEQGPIGSRLAWTGSGGPITTAIRLPANASGKSVKLRWRFVGSFWNGSKSWRIDDVVVRN